MPLHRLWLGLTAVTLGLGPVLGCDDDPPSQPAVTAGVATDSGGSSSGTGAATTSAATAATTGGSASGETGSEVTGASPLCKACWQGACAETIDACFADPACTCRFGCDEDLDCESRCDPSPVFDTLLDCIINSTLSACVEPCEAHCEACVLLTCETEFDACFDSEACACRFRCDGDESCLAGCAPADAAWTTLETCFYGQGGENCTEPCAD